MTNVDELIAEAEIGDEAKHFLESDLGKCLIGMAQQDALTAQEQLVEVDPLDSKAIIELQNKAKLAQMFEDYIKELFARGENALQVFIQQKGTE